MDAHTYYSAMFSPEDQHDNRRFGVYMFGILAVIVLVTAAFYMLSRDDLSTQYRLTFRSQSASHVYQGLY